MNLQRGTSTWSKSTCSWFSEWAPRKKTLMLSKHRWPSIHTILTWVKGRWLLVENSAEIKTDCLRGRTRCVEVETGEIQPQIWNRTLKVAVNTAATTNIITRGKYHTELVTNLMVAACQSKTSSKFWTLTTPSPMVSKMITTNGTTTITSSTSMTTH